MSLVAPKTRSFIAGSALLAIVGLLLIAPGLVFGDLAWGDDGRVHMRWQAWFAEAVWRGEIYPRWLAGMNEGFGSPAFFFYPPLTQWVASAFAPLLPGTAHTVLRMTLAVWALSVVGAIGCRLWLRSLLLEPWCATVGSLVFLLMPYRNFVDIYHRSALPETVGISVMPWLLYFATRLRSGRGGAWGGLALATGALLFTHLPSAVIGITFNGVYALVMADWRRFGTSAFWRYLVAFGTATLTGFMIAAVCVMPALGLLPFLTDTTNMWGPWQQPTHWLLFGGEPWLDYTIHSLIVLMIAFSLVFGAILYLCARNGRRSDLAPVTILLFASILVTAVMNTIVSAPFWALQTPLSRIQFPYRLLAIHVLALSGLAALALQKSREAGRAWSTWGKRVALLTLAGLFLMNSGLWAAQHVWNTRHGRVADIRQVATGLDTSEYVLGKMAAVRRSFGGRMAVPLSGNVRFHRLDSPDDRNIVYSVDAATKSSLALHQFAFTGWLCRIDAGREETARIIAYPFYVPVCAVPIGHHVLTARLAKTPFEKIGEILSAIGLLIALTNVVGWSRWRAIRPFRGPEFSPDPRIARMHDGTPR